MAYQTIYGYSGLFRPPCDRLDQRGASIYCVTTDSKRTLIAIPLTATFFLDLYHIIKHPQYQKLILIVPTVDCMYISDIYNLYTEVIALGKEFELIAPEEIATPTSDVFLTHVKVTDHAQCALYHNDMEEVRLLIDFSHLHTPMGRTVYDIILSLPQRRIFFSSYMSEKKLLWLKQNRQLFDEIHMPFNNVTYGGMSYMEVRKVSHGMIPFINVHSLRTEEEASYCEAIHIPHGMVIYNDLV